MPDGLIITFLFMVLFSLLVFFSRDEKRDVLVASLPNHSDGLHSRSDLHVAQLQASDFFFFLFRNGWLKCSLELSNQAHIHPV